MRVIVYGGRRLRERERICVYAWMGERRTEGGTATRRAVVGVGVAGRVRKGGSVDRV